VYLSGPFARRIRVNVLIKMPKIPEKKKALIFHLFLYRGEETIYPADLPRRRREKEKKGTSPRSKFYLLFG